jgi:hypothetical protein
MTQEKRMKFDLLEFETRTGIAVGFLAKDQTFAECDKVREKWISWKRLAFGCLQVPAGKKKIGDSCALPANEDPRA